MPTGAPRRSTLVLVAASCIGLASALWFGATQHEPSPQLRRSDLPPDRWTWIPIDGAECRDGSPAGFAIRPRAESSELLIFLGPGPICIDARTCSRSGAPLDFFSRTPTSGGLFASRPENPFADWNQVWVPHCTDDYHVGAARDVVVPGFDGVQQFVGHSNMTLFLEQLKMRFASVTRIALSGSSSGGQGAIANLPQARRIFGSETSMILYVDSGPPVPGAETRGILRAMTELWGADQTLLSECGVSCGDSTDIFFDYFAWMVETFGADVAIAMSAFLNDPVETYEFGISVDTWLAQLRLLRSKFLNGKKSCTFFVDARGHMLTNSMYTTTAGALTLADWLGLVLDDRPCHVGPS